MPRWSWQQPTYRRCTECEARFEAYNEWAEVCSNRCTQRRRRRLARPDVPVRTEYLPRYCTECGMEFEPVTSRTKVCSNACMQRGIRRRKKEARDREPVTT